MKTVRILVPGLAIVVLGIWLGWLYHGEDIGAVAIFLIIFAPHAIVGGAAGAVIGNISVKLFINSVLHFGTGFGRVRYHLFDLIFWSTAGGYIGACVGIATSIVIAIMLWLLWIFAMLFVPVVYPLSLLISGAIAAVFAAAVDGLVAYHSRSSFERSIWSPPGYSIISLLIAVPALVGCVAVIFSSGPFIFTIIETIIQVLLPSAF